MPAVKVNSTGKARPKIIRVGQSKREPVVTYEPDLVRVKVLPGKRGYYAVREVMKHPGTGQTQIVRNDIIRNEGEVFDMDTADMRSLPLKDGEHPHNDEFGVVEIETACGQFELPSWVTIEDADEITAEQGHKGTFGKKDGGVL